MFEKKSFRKQFVVRRVFVGITSVGRHDAHKVPRSRKEILG
jgi:hypothetical protein